MNQQVMQAQVKKDHFFQIFSAQIKQKSATIEQIKQAYDFTVQVMHQRKQLVKAYLAAWTFMARWSELELGQIDREQAREIVFKETWEIVKNIEWEEKRVKIVIGMWVAFRGNPVGKDDFTDVSQNFIKNLLPQVI
jgi:hypothetical protein